MSGKNETRQQTAQWLKQNYPDRLIAVGDCGLIPFVYGGLVLDIFGLNSLKFTHQFGKNRNDYINYLMRQNPDFFLIVSKSTHKLDPVYPSEKKITALPEFISNYVLEKKFLNKKERYHYFVYRKQGKKIQKV